MADAEQKPVAPPRGVRVGRLTSLKGVRRELARLYTDARTDNGLSPGNAAKLAYVLTCTYKILELEVIESRIKSLEERGRG